MSGKRNSCVYNTIAFAESTNNSMAARPFSVNEKLVRDRRKKQNDLFEMPKSKKAAHGRRLMYPILKERLATWIEELYSQGLIITCTAIHIRALNLIKTPEFTDKKPSDFVASLGVIP